MRLLQFVLFTAFMALGQAVFAVDLISQRAFLDDPSARMTLDEVKQQPAQVFGSVLSRGFTPSATWLRLTVPGLPNAQSGDKLVVRIRPPYLDDIELHDPLDSSDRVRKTGDAFPWRDAEFKSLNHGFVIPASTQTRDLWLRLVTTSSSFIHVEVMTPDDAQHVNRMQEMLYGLMMGLLLLFFLWAALHWLMSREVLMAMFTASQLMAIIYALTAVGYNRLLLDSWLSTSAINTLANLTYCGYVFIGFAFHYFFLREFRPSRVLLRVVLGLAISAFVTEMVLMSLGLVRMAMQINLSVVSFASVLVLLTAISCRAWREATEDNQPPIPKWTLAGFYLVVSSVLVFATMHGLGFINAPELALHMYLIHGMMTGAVLIVLLQFRAFRIQQSHHLATLRAQSAAQQIDIEKQKSQLQSRFMEMLAHELKTSLAVLHMVFGSDTSSPAMLEHGRRTVKSINDLIERCLQAERFEDKEIISHFEDFQLDELIEEMLHQTQDRERLSIACEPGIKVHSDWQLFKTVVSNLIDNALKYSPTGSTIHVRVHTADHDGVRGCELSVDNEVRTEVGSAGFPDEGELFKKYYRADGARKHSGSGLGLYLVANFMRLLGGVARYQRLNNSVRFTVWLPN